MMNRGMIAALALAVPGAGCSALLPDFSVQVDVLDQRTQLENQVRGSYEELSEEMQLVASVRGIDPSGKVTRPPPLSPAKEEALRAIQSREFNRDDLEAFLDQGCAGEANDGGIVVRPCEEADGDHRYREFVAAILEEENHDRVVLMRRVIRTNADLGEGDLDEVRTIFAGLQRESAQLGWWVQEDDGSWARKGSP